MMRYVIHWFRRDLRLQDNVALSHASQQGLPVIPLFIFDENILDQLPENDARITFIYNFLENIHQELNKDGSSLLIKKGDPIQIWKELVHEFDIQAVYTNEDYEPYATDRDKKVDEFLTSQGIQFNRFKDQVIFEKNEIVKDDGNPYSVYTPFKRKWLEKYHPDMANEAMVNPSAIVKMEFDFPSIQSIGFQKSEITVPDFSLDRLGEYQEIRDIPHADGTSHLSPHLRFGTVSVRSIIRQLGGEHQTFLSELIWREFFMQILFHHPRVLTENYHTKYDGIHWRNNEEEFEKWCKGQTGFPMVDAGMRELNKTGYMHNRVRMITASFLCKHLLIDWRWGESYFAEKLLDYELASNNGNWQWAAGTGCDAAPYFRVFNPESQQKKFDPKGKYIRKWIPEFDSLEYTQPMVDHKFARQRAIDTYKEGISQK